MAYKCSSDIVDSYATMHACISDDYYSVYASITTKYNQYGEWNFYWKMELQRYVTLSTWNTIDTRYGYVSETSPSNRTFSNIGKYNDPMRLVIHYYNDSGYNEYLESQYVDGWYR